MTETTRRGIPGSPKGQPKPTKRQLDAGFSKRLGAAMKMNPNLSTVPELAKRVQCTRAVLGKYLSGKSKTIEALLLFEIADALDTSPGWLLTGKGAMGRADALTPDQQRVLNVFALLTSPEIRDKWIADGESLRELQQSLLPSAADPFNGHRPPPAKEHTQLPERQKVAVHPRKAF